MNWFESEKMVDGEVDGKNTMARDPRGVFSPAEPECFSLGTHFVKLKTEIYSDGLGQILKSFIPSEGRPAGALIDGAAAAVAVADAAAAAAQISRSQAGAAAAAAAVAVIQWSAGLQSPDIQQRHGKQFPRQ